MKHRPTATLLLAALMASTVMAGCSSTPTQQSTGQAVDDGVVTAKVKAALVADPVNPWRDLHRDPLARSPSPR